MPGFQRIQPIGEGTIRGPARLIIAPATIAFPSSISDMIALATEDEEYAAEVQRIAITGTPTSGSFTLAFQSIQTAAIPYNATASQVAAALGILTSVASQGGVTGSGGPLPGSPVTLTFGVDGLQPLITAPPTGNLLSPESTIAVSETTPGYGQWDVVPGSGWADLGSTRSGVQVMRNNTEDQLDIDQIYGSILGVPNEWEMTVATQLAETTLERIQVAWEAGSITVDSTQTPAERHLPLGNPLAYTQRKLAVLHQKTLGPAAGRVRAGVFRLVTHSPQASTLDHQKTGQMQTLAQTFRCYADWTVSDPNARFGEYIEQEAF